eukprot:TRINITY_DN948_c0_g1_i6.p2 TRINITY_DN948_c0_g1~~TRINITY_DN948_c0_g1_i6.p2  ORF type:complete len:427 (+),score=135.46 TRINITY_DN948_c0_g1_i6:187-1281(+)
MEEEKGEPNASIPFGLNRSTMEDPPVVFGNDTSFVSSFDTPNESISNTLGKNDNTDNTSIVEETSTFGIGTSLFEQNDKDKQKTSSGPFPLFSNKLDEEDNADTESSGFFSKIGKATIEPSKSGFFFGKKDNSTEDDASSEVEIPVFSTTTQKLGIASRKGFESLKSGEDVTEHNSDESEKKSSFGLPNIGSFSWKTKNKEEDASPFTKETSGFASFGNTFSKETSVENANTDDKTNTFNSDISGFGEPYFSKENNTFGNSFGGSIFGSKNNKDSETDNKTGGGFSFGDFGSNSVGKVTTQVGNASAIIENSETENKGSKGFSFGSNPFSKVSEVGNWGGFGNTSFDSKDVNNDAVEPENEDSE